MLGSYHTNNRDIEPQIMKKFLRHQQALRLELPAEFSSLINQHNIPNTTSGSLAQTLPQNPPDVLYHLHILSSSDMALPELTLNLDFSCKALKSHIKLLGPVREVIVKQNDGKQLEKILTQLYPTRKLASILHRYQKSSRLVVCGQVYGSKPAKNCVIIAKWPSTIRAGFINYFVRHKCAFLDCDNSNTVEVEHVFAHVSWLREHIHKNWFGQSAFVYERCPSVCDDDINLLPVQRILNPCAYIEKEIRFNNGFIDKVFVIVPVQATYSIH